MCFSLLDIIQGSEDNSRSNPGHASEHPRREHAPYKSKNALKHTLKLALTADPRSFYRRKGPLEDCDESRGIVLEDHAAKAFKQMLGDMKHFKMILRKSLNLIQGMEMMNQGYINFASSVSQPQKNGSHEAEAEEGSKMSKTLCQRSSLMSLRRAIYTHTVQMISVYR